MADKDTTSSRIDFEPITIESGETISNEVNMRGMTLCGLYMPAAFTGTTITFQASDQSNGTFVAAYDVSGSQITATVSASKYIKLDPSDFAGIQHIKLVSGSAEGADREIKLAIRSV